MQPEHRDTIVGLFRSFLTRCLALPEIVLTGWMDAIADLGLEDMTEQVRALFEEALFGTCKYRPSWPTKGPASKADVQARCNPSSVGIMARTFTARSASSHRTRATLAAIMLPSTSAPISMQTPARKNPQRWAGKTRNWQPTGPI